jgi:putative FmdB family regulatory protein
VPTYDYVCSRCGEWELRQRMSDEALTKCPTCSGRCRRKIGRGSAVIFKGSGFYCTDYKKPEAKAKPKEGPS